MIDSANNTISVASPPVREKTTYEFSTLLKENDIAFDTNENFHIIGELPDFVDWTLFVSCVLPDVPQLITSLLPRLKELAVPFRIPKNQLAAHYLLNGRYGYDQLAKIFALFPRSNDEAAKVASTIIASTQSFTGPVIPTAAPVGGLVYAQYTGQIAFKAGMWPFAGKPPVPPIFSKVLKNRYKIIKTVKQDVKGDVFEGRYVKGFLRIGKCIIKEGRKYMWTDEGRRDMKDRLKWQNQLQVELSSIVTVPQAIDLFSNDGNTYFVMKYINGRSLQEIVRSIYNTNHWPELATSSKVKLLNYLIAVIEIVEKLHQNGYVHRDLTPTNFIIDKRGRIFMIDLELMYNMKTGFPSPPFGDGSEGYMSPQQRNHEEPTVHEDIYALGGLITFFFSNLDLIKLYHENKRPTIEDLEKIIQNQRIVELISRCYNEAPEQRPTLESIKLVLLEQKGQLI